MIESLPALRQQFLADKKTFYEFPADDPRKLLSLSLEQQKKRAKSLLADLRQANHWAQLEQHHPKAGQLQPDSVKLSDAQLIIARQNGFSTWARLKHYTQNQTLAKQQIQAGRPNTLDADATTLHIRCGNDIMYKLARAGFGGDFLCFADPYIQGPVPVTQHEDDLLAIRAEFLAGEQEQHRLRILSELQGDYQALHKVPDYARVCLWLEHDAYDMLVLLKLLHSFCKPGLRASTTQLIVVDHYPGVERFHGLGQLPAECMPVLWPQFKAVTDEQFEFGRLGWQAYIDKTPEAFHALASSEQPALAQAVPAMQRHLRELPWLQNGLSLSEILTLKVLLEQGSQNAARLFYHWYTCHYEPLVFMGDSSYWLVLERLANATQAAIVIEKQSDKKTDWKVSLTRFGEKLLRLESHWAEANSYDTWWGGTHNRGLQSIWYWDEENSGVVCL